MLSFQGSTDYCRSQGTDRLLCMFPFTLFGKHLYALHIERPFPMAPLFMCHRITYCVSCGHISKAKAALESNDAP